MMRTAALASLRRLAAAAAASTRSPASIRPFSSLPNLPSAVLRHRPLPPPLCHALQHARGFSDPAKAVNMDDDNMTDLSEIEMDFTDPEAEDYSDGVLVDDDEFDESGSGSDFE